MTDLKTLHQTARRTSIVDPIVPVVTKTGALQMPRVGPRGNEHAGVNICQWNSTSKRPVLHWTAEADGCVLYEDMCAGRYVPVNGGDPIAAPEKFAAWKRAIEQMQFNEEGVPSVDLTDLPSDFYHPEIYARRKAYNGGVRSVKFEADDKPEKEAPRGQAKRSG